MAKSRLPSPASEEPGCSEGSLPQRPAAGAPSTHAFSMLPCQIAMFAANLRLKAAKCYRLFSFCCRCAAYQETCCSDSLQVPAELHLQPCSGSLQTEIKSVHISGALLRHASLESTFLQMILWRKGTEGGSQTTGRRQKSPTGLGEAAITRTLARARQKSCVAKYLSSHSHLDYPNKLISTSTNAPQGQNNPIHQ